MHFNELLIVFNIENGLVSVLDFVHANRCDIDGVSLFVVYFEHLCFIIFSAETDLKLFIEGICSEKSVLFNSSDIFSAENKDCTLIRVVDIEAEHQNQVNA